MKTVPYIDKLTNEYLNAPLEEFESDEIFFSRLRSVDADFKDIFELSPEKNTVKEFNDAERDWRLWRRKTVALLLRRIWRAKKAVFDLEGFDTSTRMDLDSAVFDVGSALDFSHSTWPSVDYLKKSLVVDDPIIAGNWLEPASVTVKPVYPWARAADGSTKKFIRLYYQSWYRGEEHEAEFGFPMERLTLDFIKNPLSDKEVVCVAERLKTSLEFNSLFWGLGGPLEPEKMRKILAVIEEAGLTEKIKEIAASKEEHPQQEG